MDANDQLEYFRQYDVAKANLAKHCNFASHLDIVVNLTTKWHFADMVLYFEDDTPLPEEFGDIDDFEYSETAHITKENELFTVFLVDDCFGNDYYLLVLNENKVEL